MPAEQAGQGEQAEASSQTASTPTAKEAADKQTTTTTDAERAEDKSVMDHLGIPPEIQAQIEPKEEAKEGDSGESPLPEKAEEGDSGESPLPEKAEEGDSGESPLPEGESEDELKPAAEEKPDKRQKRIDRLTRQKHDLEEEARELREKLEKVEGSKEPQPTPAATGWFPDEETAREHAQLSDEKSQAEALIAWCEANADGAVGENEKFIEPSQVAAWKSKAQGVVLRTTPEIAVIEREVKQAARKERNQFDGLAKQIWPQLFDKGTKEYQIAQGYLKLFPQIKSHPRAMYALGCVLEGEKSLTERVKAAKNGEQRPHRDISEKAFAPRVPVAPHTPETPSREVTPSPQKKFNEAMSNLVNDPDGGVGSLTKVFEADEEASRATVSSRDRVRS